MNRVNIQNNQNVAAAKGEGFQAPSLSNDPSDYINKKKFSNIDMMVNTMILWVGDKFDSSEQVINALRPMKFLNGKDVFDDINYDMWKEVVNMFIIDGYDKTMAYIQVQVDYESFIFNQPAMQPGRDKILQEMNIIMYERKGTVGLGKCANCGCKELVQTTMQTRGADEGKTEFRQCVRCGFQWRVGG